MSEFITKTGVVYRVLSAVSPVTWNNISFWSKASDIEFDDGDTAEEKLGAINGITSDTAATSADICASAQMVNGITGNLTTTLATSSWSSSTTTVNGTAYYTYTLTVNKVWDTNPVVSLSTTVSGQTVPTQTETDNYNNIAFVTANVSTNQIKFYATSKPTVALKVVIKGAK